MKNLYYALYYKVMGNPNRKHMELILQRDMHMSTNVKKAATLYAAGFDYDDISLVVLCTRERARQLVFKAYRIGRSK